ncbi:TonB-dependent receptor domain-containing protein [Brytella acorum]|uniref:TonB-dependent receptor n=1 Tax=Brytella acorum TaxID=2959299 RepID=A0AA35UYF4_9PROT|nr:TonB-dependent receptor [Brytella acorum]MDF3625574.1 TonB-dependent receptor [Brytella acorum]CAI9119441.1 TonB-dependent receptor [Brytella acorum]
MNKKTSRPGANIHVFRRSLLLSAVVIFPSFASAETTSSGSIDKNKVQSPSSAKSTSAKTTTRTAVNRSALRSASSETIIVTGSAVSTANNQNANPVQVITSAEIAKTSASTLGDYFARLPSMGSSGSTNYSPNGGGGASCPDIRNLGSNRALVLIDGKRQTPTTTGCVDMNTIPMDQIASVEILKDGGSELYGADAVSGVINIKLRHNLDDAGIRVRGGISDVGDAMQGRISGYKGFNFDHDRGNITVFGQYMTQSGILEKNRPWAVNNPWTNNPAPGHAFTCCSSVTVQPHIFPQTSGGSYITTTDGTIRPYTTADHYSYAQDQSLSNNLQEANLSGEMHYDFDKHFQVYANVRYAHRQSDEQMAGNPVSGSIYPSTLPSPFMIPEGNPYLQAVLAQAGLPAQDAVIYKRTNDMGLREFSNGVDTWQVSGGAQGQIVDDWNYDLSMTYGSSIQTDTTENMGNYRHMNEELGAVQSDPSDPYSSVYYDPSACTSKPGCVLVNPFQPWTGAAAKYATFTEHDHDYYQMRDFNFRVNNNHLVSLPYRHAGEVKFAGGIEHRSEQGAFVPDPIVSTGDTTGNVSQYTGGGYNVTEVYMEAQLQLLKDTLLAKDLTIDGQGRYSNYNTFGDAENWKLGINWAPIRDIRFRATLGTSFRAPNISEMYGGQALGYPGGNDPCAQVASYGSLAPIVEANCHKYGNNPATFVNPNSGQIPTVTGGNPKLQPETGRTYTIGTVITPRWIRGLSASVEYWHYTLKNMIQTYPVQYIVDQCYTGMAPSYCSFVAPRTGQGAISQVFNLDNNMGSLITSGIDFDLNYRLRVTPFDTFSLSNNFQYLTSYLQNYLDGGAYYNYAGRLFENGGSGQPRVRDYAQATWTHGEFSFTYMMTYTGGMLNNNGSNDEICGQVVYCKVPGIFTHDITIGYHPGRWDLQAGVSNLLDKKPPFVPLSGYGTNINQYGGLLSTGRYVFLSAGVNF